MTFNPPLQKGYFIKRYKRFLLDTKLSDGKLLTMHCPNTGSMKNCGEAGDPIWYSISDNKNRKYPNTFELVQTSNGSMIGINTMRANTLVKEAITEGVIVELSGYQQLLTEVRYGNEKSRIDVLLTQHPQKNEQNCYVEIKSVTLMIENGVGLFPDSVTKRGVKHLRELMLMRAQGHRAVLLFCVQNDGIESVQAAKNIDPEYAITLIEAHRAGVEILAYKAEISPIELKLVKALPVNLLY